MGTPWPPNEKDLRDNTSPPPPLPPANPWRDRFEQFIAWFKANALNAGLTLLLGYILGRIFH